MVSVKEKSAVDLGQAMGAKVASAILDRVGGKVLWRGNA